MKYLSTGESLKIAIKNYQDYFLSKSQNNLDKKNLNCNLTITKFKKQIAKAVGIHESTLYRHLNNEITINRLDAINYAKVLNCNPVDLLFKIQE